MSMVRDIHDQAMALSARKRASLAHALILSLNDPSDFELSPPQEAEIQRHHQSVRSGNVTGRPANEVFADVKATCS